MRQLHEVYFYYVNRMRQREEKQKEKIITDIKRCYQIVAMADIMPTAMSNL